MGKTASEYLFEAIQNGGDLVRFVVGRLYPGRAPRLRPSSLASN